MGEALLARRGGAAPTVEVALIACNGSTQNFTIPAGHKMAYIVLTSQGTNQSGANSYSVDLTSYAVTHLAVNSPSGNASSFPAVTITCNATTISIAVWGNSYANGSIVYV